MFDEYRIEDGPRGVKELADVNREDLALFLGKHCKVGAEIGVAAGEYSESLMKANPEMTLYGVDPYTPYEGYKDYELLKTFAKLKSDAHQRLDKYPTYKFVEKTSMDAVKDFEDGSLDFVYIDGNHSDPWVTDDINAWTPKVKSGGFVTGHDYAILNRGGSKDYKVIGAVTGYTRDRNIQLYIWGLQSKADPTLKRDGSRSWFFIKP